MQNIDARIENITSKHNQYPYNPNFNYYTELERINLDHECEEDLANNNGFIINEPKAIKKSVKDPNGIFSTRFGQTISDMNPFADRYKCECGETMGRIYHNLKCSKCGTEVKFIDDNFEYFGWIKLNPQYSLIHPNLYKTIEFIIGADKLNNIIKPYDEKDQDGNKKKIDTPKDEPFFGIGMIEFKKRFDEIIDFYISKNKMEWYDDLMNHRSRIFINSVPVFTTHLRPFRLEGDTLYYGDTNNIYRMLARLAHQVNKDNIKIYREEKPKYQLLYDMQVKYNELYDEILEIMEGKKGTFRSLFGGRCTFTSRDVIVPDPMLRSDECTLPYKALVELLQQSIINILQRSYNMTSNDAYTTWYKASITMDKRVYDIIKSMIKNHDSGRGIPVLINRN